MTTQAPILEYLNRHNIWWIPLHITIGPDGKKGAPRVPDGFDPSRFVHFPKGLTQADIDQIQQHAEECEFIGIDTRTTHQFDVDVMKDPVPKMMEELPYFPSSSKGFPHFFFKSSTKPTKLRSCFEGDKDLELLTGQWSYARKDAMVINADKEIGVLELESGPPKKKERKVKTEAEPEPDRAKFYQQQIQRIVPNNSRTQVKEVLASGCIKTNGHWCGNVGRAHKGNHVYFIERDGCLIQKCTDLECIDYESDPYPMSEAAPVFTDLQDIGDREALRLICDKFPEYLKMWNKTKMVYDPTTGQWCPDDFGAFIRLIYQTWSTGETGYASQRKNMEALWALVVALPNDAEFFERAKDNTRGKLLFKNGIWDKLTESRLEFSPQYYFLYCVPFPIPESRPTNVDMVDRFHFTQPYPEEGVADWLRQDMMKAIFGLGSDTITFETGTGRNGKSRRAEAFRKAFGPYVGTLSGNHITKEKNPTPGGANAQLMPLKDKRLLYVSEPGKGMVIDMELVKKITGGDNIACRALYKGVEEFKSLAKIHFTGNSVGKFSECEASFMERRLRQLDSNTRYLDGIAEDDEENQIYRADEALCTQVINACAELIWIMIHEPLRNLPVPPSIKLSSRETIDEQDDLKKQFLMSYEACEGGKVFSKTLCEDLGVNSKFLAGRMLEWGFRKPSVVRIGPDQASGYVGLKRKVREY